MVAANWLLLQAFRVPLTPTQALFHGISQRNATLLALQSPPGVMHG